MDTALGHRQDVGKGQSVRKAAGQDGTPGEAWKRSTEMGPAATPYNWKTPAGMNPAPGADTPGFRVAGVSNDAGVATWGSGWIGAG